VKTGELAHGPQFLPGGDDLLYTLASAAPATPSLWDNAKIVVLSIKSNQTRTLLEGGTDARYAPTGHIVYANAGRIVAVPFDATRLEVTGRPTTLIQGVRNAGPTTGTTQFSFSDSGALIYLSAAAAAAGTEVQVSFVDFSGNVKPLRTITAAAFGPRISPDGKKVAYRANGAIWIADLTNDAPPRQLSTMEPGEAPVWSPDGERMVFISIYNSQEALFERRADGTGSAQLLADRARAPESWSAVHDAVSFITLVGPSGDAGDYDIWTYSFKDKKASPHIVIPPSAQSGSRFSPDGKWMAYESNETGRAEVYVEPYPRTGQRFQISKNGGSRPLWTPDGSRLFFDDNNGNPARMYSADVRTQPGFTSMEPQPLPVTGFVQPRGTIRRQFDITPDGRQFLMMFQAAQVPPQIEIVSNWFDQLRQRAR
jgi:eukaryotic-like serine/threonine-protein kinase